MALLFRVVVVALMVLLVACGDSSAPQTAAPAAGSQGGQDGQIPIEELLAQANEALQAKRLFDPAEGNAMALFLEVSERDDSAEADPNKRRRLMESMSGTPQQQAKLALIDMMRFGLLRVEQALREGELNDARRIIGMLDRAQPGANSVAELKTKFDSAVANARTTLQSTPFESLPPIISKSMPAYPARARRREIEGWVFLTFAVQKDGSVGEVRVKASEPAGVFEAEAIKAIHLWKFDPIAREVRAQQRFDFSLDGG